ncbi:hemolysin family protein [Ruania alba]|uniref:Hemolysin, contains CBS domains n=1 Tax=Ruania alba TaxID=648782 RepID=A0A1H5F0R1_9MICO|nr:hemolysin family protein [Ruania alba]SED96941.1 Hemolysin, contains CBS domains [Ruania alba]
MIEILFLILAMALVVGCGAFVAAEFAFVTVNRAQVEADAAAGDRGATRVLGALRTLSTQLSGAQLGITVTNLAIGYLSEPSIARLLQGPLDRSGLSETAARSVSLTVAMLLATAVTMIVGELIPKNLAIAAPMRTAKAVVRFQRGFTWVNTWPIRFFNGTANRILRLMGIEPQEELASARSAEELSALVRHSAREGTLAEDTAELVERSLAFGDRRARDAMTPLSQVISMRPEDSLTDLIRAAKSSGHSRFPVIEMTQDSGHTESHVLGLVHVRGALSVPFDRRDITPVSQVVTDATLVPDSLELDTLMDDLRDGGLQMAVLIDEFGSPAGLVTLEDLVEEIVGEVKDEHDENEPEPVAADDGTWAIPGLMRVDEVSELIDAELPEDEAYDTIGGLLADELERLPEPGDHIELTVDRQESEGQLLVRFEVVSLDGHRVDTVRLELTPITPDEDDDQDEIQDTATKRGSTGESPEDAPEDETGTGDADAPTDHDQRTEADR